MNRHARHVLLISKPNILLVSFGRCTFRVEGAGERVRSVVIRKRIVLRALLFPNFLSFFFFFVNRAIATQVLDLLVRMRHIFFELQKKTKNKRS